MSGSTLRTPPSRIFLRAFEQEEPFTRCRRGYIVMFYRGVETKFTYFEDSPEEKPTLAHVAWFSYP